MNKLRVAVARKRKHRKLLERESAVIVRYLAYMRDEAVEVDVKQDFSEHRHRIWLTRAQAINLARSILRKFEVTCSGSRTASRSSEGSASGSSSSGTRSKTSTRSARRRK